MLIVCFDGLNKYLQNYESVAGALICAFNNHASNVLDSEVELDLAGERKPAGLAAT